MSQKERKMRKDILTVIMITTLTFVSFYKITFFLKLSRCALASESTLRTESLAKLSLTNNRLDSLTLEYKQNENFLAFYAIESIIKHSMLPDYYSLLPSILEKFHENIFFEHFNLYEGNKENEDWENFDSLTLTILKRKEYNTLSYQAIKDLIQSDRIKENTLSNIVLYLNWQRNFDLAEDLLNLAKNKHILSNRHMDTLSIDLLKRKYSPQGKKKEVNVTKIETRINSILSDHRILARIEKNLLFNGNFKKKKSLSEFWDFSDMSDTHLFSKGSFCGGIDFDESYNMRVMGFFIQKTPERDPARGGFWYKEPVYLKQNYYLLYFRYKTLHGEEKPSFWLSDEIKKEFLFEQTAAQWKEVLYIFDNTKFRSRAVKPLLRMWGTGSVWFDDIYFTKVECEGEFFEKDKLIVQ